MRRSMPHFAIALAGAGAVLALAAVPAQAIDQWPPHTQFSSHFHWYGPHWEEYRAEVNRYGQRRARERFERRHPSAGLYIYEWPVYPDDPYFGDYPGPHIEFGFGHRHD